MKLIKLSWMLAGFLLSSCEPPLDEDGAPVTESELLLPGNMFTRTVPPAPPVLPRVDLWAPGFPLIPRGYTPLSFYVVYAGKEGQPSIVEAAGFDVVGQRTLFQVEFAASRLDVFLTEVAGHLKVGGLGSVGTGISGNVTVKCCKIPGTHFQPYFWSIAYLNAEAYAAPY